MRRKISICITVICVIAIAVIVGLDMKMKHDQKTESTEAAWSVVQELTV